MNIIAAVALVAFLIFIHELGHFLAAKLFGMEVPVFSIGFGRPLLAKTIGGTEYRLSVLPFGGYVRYAGSDPFGLDDADGGFLEHPVWQRLVVIAAGPAANLLLPVVVFTALLMAGEPMPGAEVGAAPADALLQPGDRIVVVDGQPVESWGQAWDALTALDGARPVEILRRGEPLTLTLTGLPAGVSHRRPAAAVGVDDPASPAGRAGLTTGAVVAAIDGQPVADWLDVAAALEEADEELTVQLAEGAPLTLHRDAAEPWGVYPATVFIGEVAQSLPGSTDPSPAARAGLMAGDRIAAVDGKPVHAWQDITAGIAAADIGSGEVRTIEIEAVRAGEPLTLTAAPALVTDTDALGVWRSHTMLGVAPAGGEVSAPAVSIKHPFPAALRGGLTQTVAIGGFIVEQLGRLVTGEAALSKSIGGPVEMVRQASAAAAAGIFHYARLLGAISLSVGIVNLLPVPVLDGGQLLFYLMEAIRGRPVSLRIRERAQQLGVLALTLLMLTVLVMDLHRLITG